jgi:outer membrane protein assembly factor BamC
MKSVEARLALVCLSVAVLSACSTVSEYLPDVKGYFPDKEKDYQFSNEIAPLKIPADIAKAGVDKPVARPQLADDTEKVALMPDVVKAPAPKGGDEKPNEIVIEESKKPEPTQVDLVKFSNGAVRLRFNKPLPTSVRLVSKALTHKNLEITRRDQANGEFTVQYDPNETDFRDEDFVTEFDFLFGKDHSQEKPYLLKLVERNRITELAVLDEQGKPLADGNGLSLLKLLLTTLKADLATESAKK